MTEGSASCLLWAATLAYPECADRTLKLITGPRALSEPSRFEPVTALYEAICIKSFCICCTACLFVKLSLACNVLLSIRDELSLLWIVSKWKLQLSPFRTFLSLSSSIWINCLKRHDLLTHWYISGVIPVGRRGALSECLIVQELYLTSKCEYFSLFRIV